MVTVLTLKLLHFDLVAQLNVYLRLWNERIKFMFTQKSLMLIYHEMIKIGYHVAYVRLCAQLAVTGLMYNCYSS